MTPYNILLFNNFKDTKVYLAISCLLIIITVLLFVLYLFMTEVVGAIWFYKFNQQHENISKLLVCIPFINLLGYAKYAEVDMFIAVLQLVSGLLIILSSVNGLQFILLFFLLYNLFNCYLVCKFGRKYKLNWKRIFVSCIVGRFLTIGNCLDD